MTTLLDLALANLLSPIVLCFALGAFAAFVRSDLEVPEAIGKGLAIYLMLAIGMKGGAAMGKEPLSAAIATLGAALTLSFLLPILGFALLSLSGKLDRATRAAVAAHYGSVSVVTFVAASEFVAAQSLRAEGFMVAAMAVMETPAIVTGLLLARAAARPGQGAVPTHLLKEVATNGSVLLLVGGFAIGWAVGPGGMGKVQLFIGDLFNGALCLFLLDMGLVAVRRLRAARGLPAGAIAFGLYMPLISAALALPVAAALGLSVGGGALFMTLAASASYIAVPAAMRLALPEADPGVYVPLSLGVTFPFNVAVGIPLYAAAAQMLLG